MNYKDKYNKLVEAIKVLQETNPNDEGIQNWINDNVPELKESEDEKIRKELIEQVAYIIPKNDEVDDDGEALPTYQKRIDKYRAWLEKQREPEDKGEISDGYHTFNELYMYRLLYNAAFFNLLPKHMVHKSKRHHDGEECFDGGWFIVMANLPTGQISNHYELKDWDLFQVPEKYTADEWDGHTPQEAADRLHKYLLEKQGEQSSLPKWKYKKDDTPLLRDSLILNKYGCVLKAPSGAIISDAWILDYAELAELPREEPEKQDEQKPADVEPKFHEGDAVVSNQDGKVYTVGTTYCITGNNICLYDVDGNHKWTNKDGLDRNYHLWTIQDAKDGDILMTTKTRNCPFIYRKTDYNNHLAYYYAGVDGNGDFCEGCLKRKMYHFGPVANITPATKEQYDLLFWKMKEAGYVWDADKKELKKIRTKK